MNYISIIINYVKILFSTSKQREEEFENSTKFLEAIKKTDKLSLAEVLERAEKYYKSTGGTKISLSPQIDKRMDKLIKKYSLDTI